MAVSLSTSCHFPLSSSEQETLIPPLVGSVGVISPYNYKSLHSSEDEHFWDSHLVDISQLLFDENRLAGLLE